MLNIVNKEKCCGCAACANICPKEAITMTQDLEGFYYPSVLQERCIDCGLCDKVCQFNTVSKTTDLPVAYAAYCLDTKLRQESSSGGIFSLLAECVLEKGGIVYGVAMSEDCRSCSYIKVENKKDLPKLRGSKYFQAQPPTIYCSIKEELATGKMVLFSGTGCQINALKNFLSNDYSNLITVDVICHGCPSPKLWESNIDYFENRYNDKIKSVNFRNKKLGWEKYELAYEFQQNSICFSKEKDAFMQMFLRNYSLRPSCYICPAKMTKMSDITLGDFWGVRDVLPEMYDDNGTSLVLLRSEKGKHIFDLITQYMKAIEVPYEDAVLKNSAEYASVEKPNSRDKFFEDMRLLSFEELSKKYNKKSYKYYIKHMLVKIGVWKYYEKYLNHNI